MAGTISQRTARILLGAVILGGLGGCNSMPTRDPEFAPVAPAAPAPVQASPGAIFVARDQGAGGFDIALFRDIRAYRVGDLLTVRLVEKTDATKESETTLKHDTDFTVTNPTVLGATPNFHLPLVNRLLNTANDSNNLAANLQSEKSFDGQGDSSQSNSISGEISVTVAEVLPNGNLVVRGEKIMTINRGHEHIRLSGIVRPQDIDANNSVESTRVANATIVYAGEGEVADANAVGWLARFFLSVFWPL